MWKRMSARRSSLGVFGSLLYEFDPSLSGAHFAAHALMLISKI